MIYLIDKTLEVDKDKASDLLFGKVGSWINEFIRLLPNIVLAALILVLGLFIARWIRKLSYRIIKKFGHNETLNNLFSSFIYVIALGIIFFIILSILNLDKAVTSILAGAGIIGLALAFAFQDIAANFMSGIFISFRKPLKVGDIVLVQGFEGQVVEVNLRDTVIDTFKGQLIIIPNKDVYQNPIENFSHLKKRRFDLPIGVSYGEDLDKVKQVTIDAVKDVENVSKEHPPVLFFTDFGESSINFSIRIWIDSADSKAFRQMGSDAIVAIKKAFDVNDIQMPFPTRTLDFGVRGGKTLTDMNLNIIGNSKKDKPEEEEQDQPDDHA
jgi:small conductance mechanosensitive channel